MTASRTPAAQPSALVRACGRGHCLYQCWMNASGLAREYKQSSILLQAPLRIAKHRTGENHALVGQGLEVLHVSWFIGIRLR